MSARMLSSYFNCTVILSCTINYLNKTAKKLSESAKNLLQSQNLCVIIKEAAMLYFGLLQYFFIIGGGIYNEMSVLQL